MPSMRCLEPLFTRRTHFPVDDITFDGVHAGDMMSLVLRHADPGHVLVTALNHVNCVAVAVMKGCPAIIFCEGIDPGMELLRHAEEENIVVYHTDASVAEAVITMHEAGCT